MLADKTHPLMAALQYNNLQQYIVTPKLNPAMMAVMQKL
jgi:hypothetical protein